jgi:transposase-like protein
MKKHLFKKLIRQMERLSSDQFWQVKDIIDILGDKKKVTLILEDDIVTCGHCGSDKYIKNGRRHDLQRYKCKSCGKHFNQLTGTPLANLRMKGRWLTFSECLRNGYSVRESARLTGIDKKTAFRWRHRFLKNSNEIKANKLQGVIENLETKFKYSEKGAKVIMFPERIGTDVHVLTSINRNRFVSEALIEDLKTKKIIEFNKNLYSKDSLFCSDNKYIFTQVVKLLKLRHGKINTKKGLFVNKDIVHTKNAYSYNLDLHNWMKRFKGVATKYLHNYLSWYRGLNEYYKSIPPHVLLMRAKSKTRFPYQPITPTKAEKLEYLYNQSKLSNASS